jgi:hypothetical protein
MIKIKDMFKYMNRYDAEPLFQTMVVVESLRKEVEQYFIAQEKTKKAPTLQGLILSLGMSKDTFYYYLNREHKEITPEIKKAQDIFNHAKLYIENVMLNKGIDNGNSNALWYLSRFKEYSPDYNPKQEIDITKNKQMSEEDINQELLKLEQKEKELIEGDK